MARDESGLTAALADAAREAALPGDEQIEMCEIAALPLLKPLSSGRLATGGRPKGALNKSTKELAAYVLARHRHPVIASAEIADMPVHELARQLGCTVLEASRHQLECRAFVARYTLQAMPQSVQVDVGTVGMLYVINQDAPKAGDGPERSPHALDITVQQNQGFSAASDAVSDGGMSDETQ